MKVAVRYPISTRFTTHLTIWALVGMLASCSQGPSLSLTVEPSSVVVVPGGSATIQVTLGRGGTAGDVSLSVAPSAGLSFSFSPSTLSGSETTSTLTVTAAAASAEGPRDVTLTASGAGLTATTGLGVDVQLMTVVGTVIGQLSEPLSGRTVYIAGHAPTTTLADGTFSIGGVSVPYDLTVVYNPTLVSTYVGLSTAAPTVLSYAVIVEPPAVPQATVSGNFTGAFSPIPPSHVAVVCPEGLSAMVMATNSCATGYQGNANYTIDLAWDGASDTQVRLRSYLYQLDGDGAVSDIVAAATSVLDITDGGVHVHDIALVAADPALASIQLDVSAPAGYNASYQVLTSLASTRSFLGPLSAVVTSPVQVLAPQFAGSTYTVLASVASGAGTSGVWRTGLTNGGAWSVVLPAGPTVLAPPDGATGVDTDTSFTVNNPVGGAVHFVVSPAVPTDPTFLVSTIGASVKLPDLSDIGFDLPSGHDYQVQVLATPHTATADDMVTGRGYFGPYLELLAASRGGPPPTQDGSIFVGIGGQFTLD